MSIYDLKKTLVKIPFFSILRLTNLLIFKSDTLDQKRCSIYVFECYILGGNRLQRYKNRITYHVVAFVNGISIFQVTLLSA